MSKGLVDHFIGLYRSILEDAAGYHPTLRREFDRDLSRLKSLAEHHGEKVFTLLLPALGKILDSSFDSGTLVFSGEPLSRSSKRKSMIPRLFRGLWKCMFSDSGVLKQDIDPYSIFLLRTLLYTGKALEMECAPEVVHRTVKEYYDVDSILPFPSKIWRGETDDPATTRGSNLLDRYTHSSPLGDASGDTRDLLSLAQRVGDRISSVLGEFLPGSTRFRHGPGAVSDIKSGMGYKYAFPAWSLRLNSFFHGEELALANLSPWLEGDCDDSLFGLTDVEPFSRLLAVPKTQKAPRLIACEPTANQWCQQSVLDFLTDAIRKDNDISRSIDFQRQDLSGSLALSSSLSMEYATVDLSSASDRLSCWLVECLFRRNFSLIQAFSTSRTRFILNDIDKKSPHLYELRKFASMGSALTFPVQTLTFFILCLSAGLKTTGLSENRWRDLCGQVRVYGDDLIVPVAWMPCVRSLLSALYLKVNESKTFSKGNFRESCGVDAYRGVKVNALKVSRFYTESAPSSIASVVEVSNNFFSEGMFATSNYLASSIPRNIRKYIPWVRFGSGTFGLYTFGRPSVKSRKRWNNGLQRYEYEAIRFRAKRDSTLRHEGVENLLQYFTEDPSYQALSTWVSGVFSTPTMRMHRGWEALTSLGE